MAFVGSAKFAFLVQIFFFVMALHPAICASLPAPKEQDTDPTAKSRDVPALRHVVKRHALSIVKDTEVYAVPSTPAPRPMATALENTGKILRLAALLPAKSLKLVRMVGVGLLNTSIGIPETILEKASQLSLSDLHFGGGLPATTTPPPVEEPTVKPDHPAPARDWVSELAALKLQKLALLKQIKLLKHIHHKKVVIHKKISIGLHDVKKAAEVTTPTSVQLTSVTTPAPIKEVILIPAAPVSAITTEADATTPADVDATTPADVDATTPADVDLDQVVDNLSDKLSDKLSDNEIAAPLKPTSVELSLPEAS